MTGKRGRAMHEGLEACLHYLLEATPDCIWVKDRSGRYLYANPASGVVLGSPPDEVIGKDDSAFFSPEDAQAFIDNDRRVMESDEIVRFEESGPVNEELHTYLSIKLPYRDQQGEVIGVVGMCRDITDRKRTEEALRRSNEMLKVLSTLAASHPAGGEPGQLVARIAEAVSEHLGLEVCVHVSESQGGLRVAAVHGLTREESEQLQSQALQIPNSSKESEDPLREPLSSLGMNSFASFPLVLNGTIRGYLGFGTRRPLDVESILNEAPLFKLITAQVASAIERSEFVRELTKQASELRTADRRKDEFLAMLAHELRNPLGAIAMSARILGTPGTRRESSEWATNVIERQVKHLTRLIDDLLDVSRITRGKITLKQEIVDIASVVKRVLEAVDPLIVERGHTLHVQIDRAPITVEGDPVRLGQIFENIITNAAKYSGERGNIWITLKRENEEVVVSIKDDGIGIAPEVLPYVFDLFAQADRTLDRSEGGLGIGLTLVKRLCELHHGSVSAISEGINGGTQFVVRLPFVPAVAKESTPEDGSTAENGRGRVLLVEDNLDIRGALRALLESVGFTVETAGTGTDALKIVEKFSPEFAILDIGLPGMDGYELARTLRKQRQSKDAVMVAISGYAQERDVQQAKEAGFNIHFRKPVDFDQLLEALSSSQKPAS